MNLVVGGSARLGVGDREVLLQRGQAALLQPGQDHELLDASQDLELYVFALRPQLAAREPEFLAAAGGVAHFSETELSGLAGALHGLSEVAAAEPLEQGVVELWSRVVAGAGKPPVVPRRAVATLRAERSLPGAQLAQRLNTTPSELSRAFRRSFGVPLVEYRSRLRLLEFVRLVDAGQTLTGAALNADFGSYAQCFRVFERALGCSPTAYFAGARLELDQRLSTAALKT